MSLKVNIEPDENGNFGAIGIKDSTGLNLGASQPNDTIGPPTSPLAATGFNQMFNESTWDRVRNNTQGTLLASAARTVNTSGPTITNYNSNKLKLTLNVTTASGTGGLTLKLFTSDPVSGAQIQIWADSTARTTTGEFSFDIGIGCANNFMVPRSFYIAIATGDATSYTYSVGYFLNE